MNLWALWVSCRNCLFLVFLGSAGIPWALRLLLVLVLPFSGHFLELFGLCFGPGVRGVIVLGGLGGQGFETDFRHYNKIIHWNWERYSFPILDSYACMLALGRFPESISDGCDFGRWSCRPLPKGKLKRKTIVRTFNFSNKVFII